MAYGLVCWRVATRHGVLDLGLVFLEGISGTVQSGFDDFTTNAGQNSEERFFREYHEHYYWPQQDDNQTNAVDKTGKRSSKFRNNTTKTNLQSASDSRSF